MTCIYVHKMPSDCPRAWVAWEIADADVALYKSRPECTACGDREAYSVKVLSKALAICSMCGGEIGTGGMCCGRPKA